jgi:hypothetical protein
MALRRGALVALLGVGALGISAPPTSAQTTPEATVEATGPLESGRLVTVTGRNWPAHSNVLVELCGRLGPSTLDCDRPRSRTVGVAGDGILSAVLTAGVPPSPCPCVVRVSSLATQTRVAIPVEVAGAPFEALVDPLAPQDSSTLHIDGIRLEPAGVVGEWFGAAPRRNLTFRVTNSGTSTLRDVPVEILLGSDPVKGRQIDVEPIAVLEPGATSVVAAEVELDPLMIGRTELQGAVGRDSWQAAFRTGTSSFPWGLLVVGLLLVQTTLVLGRNALRRRLHPAPAGSLALAGGATAAPTPTVVGWPSGTGLDLAGGDAVIDLRDPPGAQTAAAPIPVRGVASAVPEPPTEEPARTLALVIARLDELRRRATAPDGTVVVVAVAAPADETAMRVAVRATPFSTSAGPAWAAPEGLDDELDTFDGPLSPRIIEAIGRGRPIALGADDDLERHLAALAGLIGAELLKLAPKEGAAPATVAVALTAPVAGATHLVVVEAPKGGGGAVPLSMSAVRTADGDRVAPVSPGAGG